MALQINQQPGTDTGEKTSVNLAIPHGLDVKNLSLDQSKLVMQELYDEFKKTEDVQQKALAACSISYLVKNKGVVVSEALGIQASIDLTKFLVVNSLEFTRKD